VVRVLTGADVATRCRPMRVEVDPEVFFGTFKTCDSSLVAVRKANFVGDIVAVIVAVDRYVAEDAAERVVVDWEPLDAVTDPEAALAPGSPLVHPEWGDNVMVRAAAESGDPDAVFAGADVTVSARFRLNRHCAAPMETRVVLAAFERAQSHLTLWSSTQIPHVVRRKIAESLGHPERLLRVVAPDVGGSFGMKAHVYPEEILCALLARELGRPVKWVEDDVGAYNACPWTTMIEPVQVALMAPGPYKIRTVRLEGLGVSTHKSTAGPYRGVGLPAAQYAMEHVLDLAARRLGMDPADVRRRNILRRDEFPYESATGVHYDSATPLESLEVALAKVDYAGFRARQAEARREGRYLGIGLSSMIEVTTFGWEFWKLIGIVDTNGGYDSALVRVDGTGGVTVAVGTHSHGQGHATVYAQLVADVLGCRVEDLVHVQGDTAATPVGWGTFGSRSAVAGGGAVLTAAGRVREKVLRIAAHMMEVGPQDLEIRDGAIRVKGVPGRQVTLREVARAAVYGGGIPDDEEPGLEASCHYRAPTPFANATHLAVVEVDPETGAVKLLRYVVIEDCGRMINPMIVEGQIAGGVAQGIGNALYEHHQYDEHGQLLTTSFMDYLIPTATDVPPIEYGHLETPSPLSVGGIKGMGEGGAIAPPAAIANAVADALAPFGWKTVDRLPITPDVVRAMVVGGASRV
jgi:carbon-monoxide dehydrogenase large subunit